MAKHNTTDDGSSLFDDDVPTAKITPPTLPESWAMALADEFQQPYFAQLYNFVLEERRNHDILPIAKDVFNALRHTPLDHVRVVILGQDPYPTPGHAHGLCFSVQPGFDCRGRCVTFTRKWRAISGLRR